MARHFSQSEGCTALVFGDAETGIVLRAFAMEGVRQEDHDRLLAMGASALNITAPDHHLHPFGIWPERGPHWAQLATPGALHLFLRHSPQHPEVLCTRYAPLPVPKELPRLQDDLLELVRHG